VYKIYKNNVLIATLELVKYNTDNKPNRFTYLELVTEPFDEDYLVSNNFNLFMNDLAANCFHYLEFDQKFWKDINLKCLRGFINYWPKRFYKTPDYNTSPKFLKRYGIKYSFSDYMPYSLIEDNLKSLVVALLEEDELLKKYNIDIQY
jgi:hypothetical protein